MYEPVIIDWYKLVDQTGDTDMDVRCAGTVLNKLGIKYNKVMAYQEDTEDGGWMLAVS